MAEVKEREDEIGAVYYSALSSLDELPDHEARQMVVYNWFKYIVAQEMRGIQAELARRFAMEMLCAEFAGMVASIPSRYKPCAGCAACQREWPERSTTG